MSMVCAISQQIPDEPVVSPLSGCVFEKRLIRKYISEYGKDPITNEPLNDDQLIEIKQFQKVIKPKLPSVSSIPDLLGQLRNEYDAFALDKFELEQNRQTLRQELSHALYQQDASLRVIARLMAQMEELQAKMGEQNELIARLKSRVEELECKVSDGGVAGSEQATNNEGSHEEWRIGY